MSVHHPRVEPSLGDRSAQLFEAERLGDDDGVRYLAKDIKRHGAGGDGRDAAYCVDRANSQDTRSIHKPIVRYQQFRAAFSSKRDATFVGCILGTVAGAPALSPHGPDLREHGRGRWNANELDGLRALIALGTPLRQIAKQLGRTQATIAEKARQVGRAPKYFR